jgi:Ca-activated chloride channel family protein
MFSKPFRITRVVLVVFGAAALLAIPILSLSGAEAQSGRKPADTKPQKKTDVQKGAEQEGQQQQQPPPAGKNEPTIKISTQVVNVEATVIDKKSHRLLTDLTKKNFTVYEDGVKQEITNFSTGDGPVTVVLLLDNGFHNHYFTSYFDPSRAQEIFMSAAGFVQNSVKPSDNVAVVTFSMKPKVIQDFTNDRQKLSMALQQAYRDLLNFSESNIFDALSFTLLGGKAIQLYEENAGPSEYVGLQEVEGHAAVILITTGIDTFSKITFDKAMKIVAGAGVPIFTVGVGNLYFKKYGDNLPATSRMTWLQAENELKTFASLTGGAYFPMTFEGEIPSIMQTINQLLRTEYSIGYVPSNTRAEGKERKIRLDVDTDGDGKPDNAKLDLRYREKYIEPGGAAPGKKK